MATQIILRTGTNLPMSPPKFGSMVTLHIGSHPAIFVRDHSLAHQALVQKGAVFSDRPYAVSTRKIYSDGSEEVVDITGSKEIKMMPFGAGRRICPALGLAMFHLEYFVVNLVWSFAWKADDGDDVDLLEKHELTKVMKTPFQAHLYSRPR